MEKSRFHSHLSLEQAGNEAKTGTLLPCSRAHFTQSRRSWLSSDGLPSLELPLELCYSSRSAQMIISSFIVSSLPPDVKENPYLFQFRTSRFFTKYSMPE